MPDHYDDIRRRHARGDRKDITAATAPVGPMEKARAVARQVYWENTPDLGPLAHGAFDKAFDAAIIALLDEGDGELVETVASALYAVSEYAPCGQQARAVLAKLRALAQEKQTDV